MRPVNSIDELLEHMVARDASDLHVTVGTPPVIRVRGEIERVADYNPLTSEETQELLYRILSSEQQKNLEIKRQLDFSHSIPGLARFRVNVYFQRESIGAAFRLIPAEIKTLEELGIPATLHQLAEKPRGLVLVTGPTGSGKSTTLAAIIDLINETQGLHIITIEDPIEFVHPNKKCLIHQREIGTHATSFAEALKAAGREDPDLILVGEMRDVETISMALSAAEKGTLVFGTLHTNNAAKTMERIISVFPAGEQEGVRAVLGETIRAVVAQQLLPKVGGGRVAALEILFASPAVGNMIREGKTGQITSTIQTGVKEGMISMDGSIRKLFDEGKITADAAYDKAIDKESFRV